MKHHEMKRSFALYLTLFIFISSTHAFSIPSIPSIPLPTIPEFPPWVWLGMVLNSANTIQVQLRSSYSLLVKFHFGILRTENKPLLSFLQYVKKVTGLTWRTLTGGKGAACGLCDEVLFPSLCCERSWQNLGMYACMQ
jgi:hypothetical protein